MTDFFYRRKAKMLFSCLQSFSLKRYLFLQLMFTIDLSRVQIRNLSLQSQSCAILQSLPDHFIHALSFSAEHKKNVQMTLTRLVFHKPHKLGLNSITFFFSFLFIYKCYYVSARIFTFHEILLLEVFRFIFCFSTISSRRNFQFH